MQWNQIGFRCSQAQLPPWATALRGVDLNSIPQLPIAMEAPSRSMESAAGEMSGRVTRLWRGLLSKLFLAVETIRVGYARLAMAETTPERRALRAQEVLDGGCTGAYEVPALRQPSAKGKSVRFLDGVPEVLGPAIVSTARSTTQRQGQGEESSGGIERATARNGSISHHDASDLYALRAVHARVHPKEVIPAELNMSVAQISELAESNVDQMMEEGAEDSPSSWSQVGNPILPTCREVVAKMGHHPRHLAELHSGVMVPTTGRPVSRADHC